MRLEAPFVRPVYRAVKRTVRTGRKFVVLTTLSTIGFAACQDGGEARADAADGERQIVFRHFV